MIDPVTRDIVEDERAMEVHKKPDGKLGGGHDRRGEGPVQETESRSLRSAELGLNAISLSTQPLKRAQHEPNRPLACSNHIVLC